MANVFRVRIKRGEHEIEVESTDKEYVDLKIKEFSSQNLTTGTGGRPQDIDQGKTKRLKQSGHKNSEPKENEGFNVAELVEHIKDSEDFTKIGENILDKKQMLGKIMLCMHFNKKVNDDPYVTTGQIQQITDQLGVKLEMANAANKIKGNQRYFSAKVRRKQGQSVPYKLTREGESEYVKILNGTKK